MVGRGRALKDTANLRPRHGAVIMLLYWGYDVGAARGAGGGRYVVTSCTRADGAQTAVHYLAD